MTRFLDILQDLKNSAESTAKDATQSFTKHMHNAYDYVMDKFHALEDKVTDKKDDAYLTLKRYQAELKASYEGHKDIAEDKLHDYRHSLVKKIEEAHKKIEEYHTK